MDIKDYEPNSNKLKEEATRKHVEEPVVEKARIKKRGGLRKLADVFLPGDTENIKSFILSDVLVPAIKKAISDVVTNGISMLLYGETSKEKSSPISSISYSQFYKKDERYSSGTRQSMDVNIVVGTRSEAETILSKMQEVIDRYGIASVADLYDLANLETNHTMNKYGWTSVATARITRRRDGWEIEMPKRMPID